MSRIGIIGAKAYTSGVLLRLLARHGDARIAELAARVEGPEDVADYFPDLRGRIDTPIRPVDLDRIIENCDAVFLALPHTASQEYAPALLEAGKVVLDLGADFRFRNVQAYEQAYGVTHAHPDLSRNAVYGLPELFADQIRQANLIGVPGCYPTSVILPLAPLMRSPEGLRLDTLIADCKSGVSGAGRKLDETYLFCEANESMQAYSVASHRHVPEIEEALGGQAGREIRLTFTPHLAPMNRGIHSTIYIGVEDNFTEAHARERLERAYRDAPFVRILPEGEFPSTKGVVGTNFCDIGLKLDTRNRRLILCSVIDNLVKGASGQALQCMNLRLGFEETEGLI